METGILLVNLACALLVATGARQTTNHIPQAHRTMLAIDTTRHMASSYAYGAIAGGMVVTCSCVFAVAASLLTGYVLLPVLSSFVALGFFQAVVVLLPRVVEASGTEELYLEMRRSAGFMLMGAAFELMLLNQLAVHNDQFWAWIIVLVGGMALLSSLILNNATIQWYAEAPTEWWFNGLNLLLLLAGLALTFPR